MEKIKVLVLVQTEEWSDPWSSLSKGVSYPVDPDSFRNLNAVVLRMIPTLKKNIIVTTENMHVPSLVPIYKLWCFQKSVFPIKREKFEKLLSVSYFRPKEIHTHTHTSY